MEILKLSRLEGMSSDGRGRRWSAANVGLLLMLAAAGSAWTAENDARDREYQVKAVLLFNLVQFVEWPATAFEMPGTPLTIGVLGQDPFGPVLDEVVRGEQIRGRSLVIRRYTSTQEIQQCHLLFVAAGENSSFSRTRAELGGRPILTVADSDGFIRAGGLIQLFTKPEGRIGLRINAEAAKQLGLAVSAKLLRLSEIVHQRDD